MGKKNLILFGVLVLLLIATYIYQGPYNDWRENKEEGNILAGATVEEVDKMEIRKNATTTISLAKDEKGWKLADSKEFYVQESVNKELNDALRGLKKSEAEEISSKADRKEEFGTGDSGVRLTLYSGDEKVEELIVGDRGVSFESSYISFPGKQETYSIESGIAGLTSKEQWGDPIIFDADKESINKVRLQYPDNEFTIEKQEEGWRGTSPYEFNVSEEKMDKVLNVMTNLVASDIPEQDFEGTGLEKHLIIAEASGDKIDNTLMVGEANDDGLYYAKKAKSDNIYLITEEQRNVLKTTIEDLR
jgi:hypothetical protein